MITKDTAQTWANLYHNKFDEIHTIELGILHSASEGKYEYYHPCPELYRRGITNSLTQDDLRLLQKLVEQHYQTRWEEGHLVVIFG